MGLHGNSYSRLVAWLKIGLPLAALGLLSVLFLFSESISTDPDLPFSDPDLKTRIAEQQITAPEYQGSTAEGGTIRLAAESAHPARSGETGEAENADTAEPEGASARKVTARFRSPEGAVIDMTAGAAELRDGGDAARLSGAVRIDSSTGYRVETEALRAGLKEMRAESEGPVSGEGPAGRFEAGRMEVTSDREGGALQLRFTGGVKLVYEPKQQGRSE